MKLKSVAAISLAGLVLSGCSGTEPLAPDAEEALAAVLVTAAEQTGEAQDGGHRVARWWDGGWHAPAHAPEIGGS